MIWQRHTLPDVTPVPFAQMGLTSLFGMGRGGHHRYSHHNFLGYIPILFHRTMMKDRD